MESNEFREHREEFSRRAAELRRELTSLRGEREEIRKELGRVPAKDITSLVGSEPFQRTEKLAKREDEIMQELKGIEGSQASLMRLIGDNVPADAPVNQALEYHGGDARRIVAANAEYHQFRESGVFESNARHFGTLTLGQLADREQVPAYLSGRPMAAALPAASPGPVGTFAGGVPVDYRGVVPPMLMPLSLLDLIPTGTTDSTVIDYVQITGLPLGAAETAELAGKPELGLGTADKQAPIRTIAAYIKLARQALADIAGLGTFINTQIPYAVRYRLLQQVLAGDGSGQNLTGIYNTSGVLAPTFTVNDNVADAIFRAGTALSLSGAEPNFVALHPNDYQALALTKNTQGNYIYVQPGAPNDQSSPAASAPLTIWGMVATRSWVVPQGTPLIGDSSAMTLMIREGLTVRTSDSDQDDFVRNRVTVLGEMRCGLVVWRPTALAKVALS